MKTKNDAISCVKVKTYDDAFYGVWFVRILILFSRPNRAAVDYITCRIMTGELRKAGV